MSIAVPELCEVFEGLAHGDRFTKRSRRIVEDAAESWPERQLAGHVVDDVQRICGVRVYTVQGSARAVLARFDY